jgi:hypothetical protein
LWHQHFTPTSSSWLNQVEPPRREADQTRRAQIGQGADRSYPTVYQLQNGKSQRKSRRTTNPIG